MKNAVVGLRFFVFSPLVGLCAAQRSETDQLEINYCLDYFNNFENLEGMPNLNSFLKDRIKFHLDALNEQFTKNTTEFMDFHFYNVAGGIPGTHAEIRSLNRLLNFLHSNGKTIDDGLLDDILGFQIRFNQKELLMVRCGDCHHIEHGVKVIKSIL